VIDLVDLPGRTRLFPVGRLDADSTGLMLLTNDGDLANRLTHPRYGVSKQYEVKVRGRLTEHDVRKLRDGLVLADRKAQQGGKRAAMQRVSILRHETDRTRGDRTTLLVTLTEGQNREIRRLLARLGFKVRKLKRTAIGPVRLKGLALGQWRLLTAGELRALKRAAK
jgi:pseudouridine synthase